MGQSIDPSGAVFLSAGIPDPAARHFIKEADSAAVSAAVSALLYVTLGRRRLVWGGHPAITPMVWAYAEAMDVDYGAWIQLYQSEFFEDDFPEETAKFNNVVVTPKVTGDVPASLVIMRDQMLTDTQFGAAVFVGGMQGVLDEFELFQKKAPGAAILPIMSAGGAAEVLGKKIDADPVFALQRDYVALLHQQLDIDPNERRYKSPSDQPAAVADRIFRPSKPSVDDNLE